jgi:hypothetical protein
MAPSSRLTVSSEMDCIVAQTDIYIENRNGAMAPDSMQCMQCRKKERGRGKRERERERPMAKATSTVTNYWVFAYVHLVNESAINIHLSYTKKDLRRS